MVDGNDRQRAGTGVEIEVSPGHLVVAVGQEAAVRVRVLLDGRPVAGRTVVVEAVDVPPPGAGGADAARGEMTTDSCGGVTLRAPSDADRRVEWVVADPVSGVRRNIYVDVVPQDLYGAFEQAAGVTLDRPMHALFLGDSLTHMQRGGNYIDKLAFWLNRRCIDGATFTFKNAGVGGDTIRAIWDRFNGRFAANERERCPEWADLLSPRPDWVFVFTGHNDSKLTAASNYAESFVPLTEFESTYLELLGAIRQRTGARLFLLSCAATQDSITRQAIERRGNYFGEPATIRRYNQAIEGIATKTGAAFVDVFTPMFNDPSPKRLFQSDGVHLNNEGNRRVAQELLRFLAGAKVAEGAVR